MHVTSHNDPEYKICQPMSTRVLQLVELVTNRDLFIIGRLGVGKFWSTAGLTLFGIETQPMRR